MNKVNPLAAIAAGHAREENVSKIYDKAGVDLYLTYERQDVTLTVNDSMMRIVCGDGTEKTYQLQ